MRGFYRLLWLMVIALFELGSNVTLAATNVVPVVEVREDFWLTDGPVYAVLATNGLVYAGGNFTNVWPVTGPCVALNPNTGSTLGDFPRVEGEVYAVIADGAGGWFLGGSFHTVGSLERQRLAHVIPAAIGQGYRVDPKWAPTANAPVRALPAITWKRPIRHPT
jgi:hypothetical protein